MRKSAACKESRDALACPPSDALAVARVAAHRSRCSGCRAYVAGITRIGSAVQAAAGPGLDDIARARMAARLALSLDELATENARRHSAVFRPALYRLAGAMLVAVVVVIAVVRSYPRRELAQRAQPPHSMPAPVAAPPAPLLIHPYEVSGASASAVAGRDVDHLELPAGAVVRASLGPHARITLVGPARFAVKEGGAVTTVRLDAGVLIGEYEHHEGGTLRIESPGVLTTIVGTLFAVEAREGGGSRVAVSRGAVVVQNGDERIHLSAGWSWSSGEVARPVIPAWIAQQLSAHAAVKEESPPSPGPSRKRERSRAAGLVGMQMAQMGGSESSMPTTTALAASAAPVAPTVEPPPVTANSLYAEAEVAMRAGELALVRARLQEVIRRFPADGLADAALLELARLAQKDRQEAQARGYLDTLLSRQHERALWEPARYLRCRLDVDAHRGGQAAACLSAFRSDFPDSPHDAEVLALLIGLLQEQGDCQHAVPLLDEYLARYPRGPLDARGRRARCER